MPKCFAISFAAAKACQATTWSRTDFLMTCEHGKGRFKHMNVGSPCKLLRRWFGTMYPFDRLSGDQSYGNSMTMIILRPQSSSTKQ